eukprot:196772-Alexandrium_andersonii.AAC.1
MGFGHEPGIADRRIHVLGPADRDGAHLVAGPDLQRHGGVRVGIIYFLAGRRGERGTWRQP